MNKALISLMFVVLFMMVSCGVEDEETVLNDTDVIDNSNNDNNQMDDIAETECADEKEEKAIQGSVYLCKNGIWKLIRKTVMFGLTTGDGVSAIKQNSEGHFYVSGDTYGEEKGQTYVGSSDAALVKLDNELNKMWWRQWGSVSPESGEALAIDNDGNIYVTGGTYKNMDGQTNKGGLDIFVTKFKSSGEKIWTKLRGTSASERASSIFVDNDNNIYLGGGKDGGTKGLIQKRNSQMDLEFEKIIDYGSSCIEHSLDIYLSSSNDLYYSFDADCSLGDYSYETAVFFVKDSVDNSSSWTQKKVSVDAIYYDGMVVDSKGDMYIAGHFKGNLVNSEYENKGNTDCFLVKYSSSGSKIWEKNWGTENYDSVDAITTDQSDNIYVVGKSNYTGYLKKFDSKGKNLWTKEWQSGDGVSRRAILVDKSGNIYIAGSSSDDKIDDLDPEEGKNSGMYITKWLADQL